MRVLARVEDSAELLETFGGGLDEAHPKLLYERLLEEVDARLLAVFVEDFEKILQDFR